MTSFAGFPHFPLSSQLYDKHLPILSAGRLMVSLTRKKNHHLLLVTATGCSEGLGFVAKQVGSITIVSIRTARTQSDWG